MPPTPSPIPTGNPLAIAGKYLTFLLGAEAYGINVLKVREIMRMMDITSVPQMPAHVRGVINLRGKVVPIVDLRIKFALAKADVTERTCIVVVQIVGSHGTSTLTGFIVDAVEEVLSIASADVEPTPDFGAQLNTDYLLGMAKIKGKVKALLDIDRVLTAQAIEELAQVVQPEPRGS
jgi:purine-binding chemotaxis protein CheW